MGNQKNTKTSLVDRIIAALKEMGHDKTVKRVIKKAQRILGETIYNAEKEIERLNEKITDKKEDIAEAYLAIDPEVAKGQEEHYAKSYLTSVRDQKSELEDLEDRLEEQKLILAAAKEELKEIS